MPQAWNRAFWKLNKALFTQAMKPPPVQPNINAIAAPINAAIPYVSGTPTSGSVLNCTMGQWFGAPTSYAYQWKRDATNVGTNSNNYTVVAGDISHSISCTVTATNSLGSTVAPASNAVAIASLAAREAEDEERGRIPPPHELNKPSGHNQPAKGHRS